MTPIQTILNDLNRVQSELDGIELESDDGEAIKAVLSDELIPLLQAFVKESDAAFGDIADTLEDLGEDQEFDDEFLLSVKGLAEGVFYLTKWIDECTTEKNEELQQMNQATIALAGEVLKQSNEMLNGSAGDYEDDDRSGRDDGTEA